MISRRSARILGETYQKAFSGSRRSTSRYDAGRYYTVILGNILYDFLYENNYPAWLCNKARRLDGIDTANRDVKDFVMGLHTGETFAEITPDLPWDQREQLGQRYLQDLAKDILVFWHRTDRGRAGKANEDTFTNLQRTLELDGYIYQGDKLLIPESDVLDVEQETTILQTLYKILKLDDESTTFYHLELSEQRYVEGAWDDAISNARKFLESTLREVASAHSKQKTGNPLPQNIYEWAAEVRNYLENEGLLETKEKKTLSEVYGLLSSTGGHPYIAQNDQARLLRHLALTFSQFVMLRFQGYLNSLKTPSSP